MKENGEQGKGKQATGSGLSSLDGLPSLTTGRGSDLGSLVGAPPLGGVKPSGKGKLLDDNFFSSRYYVSFYQSCKTDYCFDIR